VARTAGNTARRPLSRATSRPDWRMMLNRSGRGIVSINQEAHVVKNTHDTTRWSRRLIAATGSCLVSAIIVATQIPQIRDTVGIAQMAYGFIHSTVPSLGVAAIWIGLTMMLAGAAAMRRLYRVRANGAGRTAAVGAAVLVVAVGGLVAIESSFDRSTTQTPSTSYVALTTKHHRSPRRRPRRPVYHSPKGGRRSSSPASPATAAPSTPAAPPTTTSPAPATTTPAPTTTTPAPPTSNEGSRGSSSSGSGGNGNNVTVNKNNTQTTSSGSATGEGARSGEAKSENNEGPVNVNIS
jgi:hypothetical protein